MTFSSISGWCSSRLRKDWRVSTKKRSGEAAVTVAVRRALS